ncbi:MAG: PQQ-binding-like beta-propeller repeat protein [Planctomycetes bacterium]|nr:PQQ-binding-like beta-propeller repeat protein [Planctomycetota bacterium]
MTTALPRVRTRLAAWLLPVATLAPLASAQEPARELPRPTEFVAGQDDNLFSVARRQEDIHGWVEALSALETGDHAAGVERLHRLLQNEAGGVVAVGPTRYLGLRLAVTMTLANLSPAASDAYEALVAREAGNLIGRPLHDLTPDQLQRLADRYPTSKAGRRARLRLADLALEAGRATLAIGHLRQALDAAPIGSSDETAIRRRLTVANTVQRPHEFEGRTVPGRDAAIVGDVLPVVAIDTAPTTWRAVGGGSDGAAPMQEPVGQPVPQWTREVFAPGFDRNDPGLFAMHAVGDLGGIYVNTGLELIAIDPLAKEIAWESPAPLKEHAGDAWSAIQEYEEGLNIQMVLAPACADDVVVAALQVPEPGENVRFQGHFQIISKIPERRLFAFKRSTGKLLWAHFDSLDGPLTRSFRGHSSCGPPLILDDIVYAPVCDRSGAIAFYVGAYDLHTGQPRWRRLVCSSQQDVNMFGNARSEFASSPLCAHDGVLYGASNLGVAFAVEQRTGRCRWIASYEVIRMPATQLHHQPDRPVFFANSAPVVSDGVLCTTPLDSAWVLAHDADDGRLQWRLPFEARASGENRVRWLCGALGDEFVLAGAGIVAVRARPDPQAEIQARSSAWAAAEPRVRQLVRQQALSARGDAREMPRPAVTRDHVWVPQPGRIAVFDRKGNLAPMDGELRPRGQHGNLLLVDGLAVTLRHRTLDILYDAEGLRRRAEEALRAAPDDPARIIRLATMRTAMLGADGDAAARAAVGELWQRALQACRRQGLPDGHPLLTNCQRELYSIAIASARAALTRGSPDAVTLLAAARDAAPDRATMFEAWILLLQATAGDRIRQLAELERMAAVAGIDSYVFPGIGNVPVIAFVLLQKARLQTEPAKAVALWQELLERFPTQSFGGRSGDDLARDAISAAIAQHGPAIYGPIAERADAALAAAGDDPEQLRALSAQFPHARAAATARTRLLDLAVEQGNLAAAVEVLAHALHGDGPTPAILRRVLAAAEKRGNLALAAAMADRLRPFAATVSDFAPDGGRTIGAVLAGRATQTATPPPAPELPAREIARIPALGPGDPYRLLPVTIPDGFVPAPNAPLFAIGRDPDDREHQTLHAWDLSAGGAAPPLLFRHPINYLEHVWLCGRVLVVPDITRICALDYRTGELLWELPNLDNRIYECLGVQAGVLHLSAQSSDVGGGAEFVGLEPVTGKALFSRPLIAEQMPPAPKSTGDHLLLLEVRGNTDPLIHRLDPITGGSVATIPLGPATLRRLGLRAESLQSAPLFTQNLSATAELVFVRLDSTGDQDAPRVAAIDRTGAVVWLWQGHVDHHLEMAALRGDRLVVLESNPKDKGQLTVLQAQDGKPLREVALGADIQRLNWHPGWLPTPAPAALLVIDKTADRRSAPRLTCMGVDDQVQGFQYDLAADDRDGERAPVIGADFLAFGMRSAQGGPFRLYALRTADRSGALPDGRKSIRLPVGQTFGMTTCGVYTVVSAIEGLIVLGSGSTVR